MSISSIKIKNILSFDNLIINNFEDINCIVGKNNVGKSNLLKLMRFFYQKLEGKRVLPPTLNSKYSSYGFITIIYDTSRIKSIVTSELNHDKSAFFRHIYNVLFKEDNVSFEDLILSMKKIEKKSVLEVTLKINSDDSVQWSIKDKKILSIINYLYPFFDIETRHIDLYDWDKLWLIVSKLRSFNINKIKQEEIIDFFNEKISKDSSSYSEYISKIQNIAETGKYNYREKVLNYVKAGLKGQTFLIDNKSLDIQSDGTNSHRFIEIALELLITLSRREYINPIIYIDEPEVGLHPKKNEELFYNLSKVYKSFKKTKKSREKGKYKTPYPTIIFATHSPNIVKKTIKYFNENQQVLHFSKDKNSNTIVNKLNSIYKNKRFLNIFSDNEARLFFSDFILFVEGPTEVEIFSNSELLDKFDFLNRIDIYATNELALEYMNPSYLNTAIPYLILYDADKLISIDFSKNKLTFKNSSELQLFKYLKLYMYSYIGSKQKLIYDFLKQLIEWQKKVQLEFEDNLYISNFNYNLLIKYINDEFLKKENFLINRTTIEEALINKQTFCLFKRWIYKEFRDGISKAYNSKTPKFQIERIKKKKILEFKKFNRYIKNLNIKEKELITISILIFGGKTETTIATFTENYTEVDDSLKDIIKTIKKEYIGSKESLNIGHLLNKTSGWTTSFLNFAIKEMSKKNNNNEFENEFKNKFGELYAIIMSIKEKL
ncbi:MAG: hypothetical protein COA66_02845 [Arcobacter sp.]|nr:MAG: hypothetical protein COA66_02845 [Arcobacter sp.]